MAARYWVGDTNPAVWNDKGHWSTSDGGAGGASVPSTGDDVYFTSSNTNDCTVDADISIKSLSIASGYTGTFDNATNDKNVTVSGDVTLDGTRVDMGDGTWTVSGSFDNKDVTTFNRNTSTLVMNGTGKSLTAKSSLSHNFTVPEDASITMVSGSSTLYVPGLTTISGSFTNSSSSSYVVNGDLKITSTGSVTATSGISINNGAKLSQKDGPLTGYLSVLENHTGTNTICPATYESTVSIYNAWANAKTFEFADGTYTFNGSVSFFNSHADGSFNVKNSTNNPNLIFKGNVTFTQSAGTFTYTKGTGTITFSGTSAQTADFLGKSVEDIVISNTSASVSLTGNGVTTDSLTVDSGATFDLNGENLSYASASSTTNNGTIRLQGGETLTNVSDLDTNSGTVVYYGDNGGGGSPFTIKDFGTTDYYNLTFNATLGTDVFRPADTLTVANNLTITQGTFDNATNDENINVTGNVTMDNTQTDMGDGTWTVSGNWDSKDITTFNRNASTLVMNGTSKTLLGRATLFQIYSFTVATGASITMITGTGTTYATGTTMLDGAFTNNSGATYVVNGELKVSSTGSFNGGMYINESGKITQKDGSITGTLLVYGSPTGAYKLVPATYEAATVTFGNYFNTTTVALSAGTYTFNGNVTITSAKDGTTFTIDNSANNPNLIFKRNVTLAQTAGTLVYTKGTGTITAGGTSTQSLDFLGKTVEDINITNTSADVSITNDVTCDSLSASDNASIKVTAGKTITTDSVNDLGGSAGNLVTVASSSPGDVWYLIASGTPVVSYIDVTDSDASGGSEINTVGSVDGGNNTNWVFAVIKDIIQAGIIIFKR